MVRCDRIKNPGPHRYLRLEETTGPEINSQPTQYRKKNKRCDAASVPIPGQHPGGSKKIVEAWRIETETRVAEAVIRLCKPSRIKSARANGVVKWQGETKVIPKIGAIGKPQYYNRQQ